MRASRTRPIGLFLLTVAVVVFGPPGAIGIAHAATFVVDSTADLVDLAPGNGVCAAANGKCTLRAAVMEANALPGADLVNLSIFDTPHLLTIAGAGENGAETGDLDIFGTLSIVFNLRFTGPPQLPIIDGGQLDRVFHVRPGAVATIQGVIVRRGYVDGRGAGILNEGTLTLLGTTVEENIALGEGGGIASGDNAVLTLTNCIVRGNFTAASGGGIISSFGSTLTVINATVAGNSAANTGGGILAFGGVLTVLNSTVSGNGHGFLLGGAAGIQTTGTAWIVNSTISGNSGGSGNQTGIWNEGVLTLLNSTVTAQSIGLINFLVSEAWLVNTIVAGNAWSDCGGGAVISVGHNLDSDNTCQLTAQGDKPGMNPLLGPLAENGGPTRTHVLLAGSPALNAADNAVCLSMDQRGVARPQDFVCDMGAVEVGGLSYMSGKTFQVLIRSGAGEAADCLRFETAGTLVSDTLGAGTWRELGLFSVAMWWTGELTDPRGGTVSLTGGALLDRQLFAFGVDRAGVSYSISGVETPDCRSAAGSGGTR